MHKRILILVTAFLFAGLISTFAQNNPVWPKTFLWRISGNGLTKDSYLYGTMHLQDKRLFNFGDSLYRYMEKAEGYAMELDMTEMMDSLIQRFFEERQYSGEDENLGKPKDKKKYIDSLVSNVKMRKDKHSRKILERMRTAKQNSVLRTDMPTMMDAFLYGIARRQGKWLGGIEDLQDQLAVLDELGGDITSEELLSSEKEIKASLEKMISMYVSKDLNKIEAFCLRENSGEMEDISLIKRNFKMARRMDSLSHARSMFFTVGVAHLPGDSGVITLLRKKGFQLDPVFSKSTVDPLKYVSALRSVNWLKTSDDNKNYEIEMPGKPAEVSIASGLLKLKYFIDMSTITYFMITSSVVNENMNLDDFVQLAAKKQEAMIESRKKIEIKGLKGIEVRIFSNQYYFRTIYLLRENILYMIFVGGQKKETMDSNDANYFVSSFTPSKELPVASKKSWRRVHLEEKGSSILFPGEPRLNPKLAQGVINDWKFTTYDCADPSSGTYYVFQVRDIIPGFHLAEDSSVFVDFRKQIAQSMKKTTLNEVSTYYGYPVLKYEGEELNGVILKSMVINRGNRSYYLIVEGHDKPEILADMEKFLLSFNMPEYEHKPWQEQVSHPGNFKSSAPSSFQQVIDTDSTVKEEDKLLHFVSYDSLDCNSYEVFKIKISPYYSISSDSLFFEERADRYGKPTDSVLSKRWVTSGNLKGQEWLVQKPGYSNLKKFRLFVNGDTLYYVVSYMPAAQISKEPYQKFFEDFRIIGEDLHPGIYQSKTVRILNDLQSMDSTVFSKASEAFSAAKFNIEDKPLLEEALLKQYQDDASSGTNARDKIFDTLQLMMDNNTLSFIKSGFSGLNGNREFIKLNLLNLLVNYKTQDSYNLLKELLIKYPPRATGEYMLSYRITDSLELARSLFPELLQLSNNPVMALRIMEITSVMLEKKMIPESMLDPYRSVFIHTADTAYDRLSKLDFIQRSYLITDMLNLIRQLKDSQSNRILNKYLGLETLSIKQNAILNLLRNDQQVDPKQIEKVAAEKSYRNYFYAELFKIGKTSVFPAAYNSQQSIAEADIYDYSTEEDYEPSEIKSLGVKTVQYMGKTCKIFLFRLLYEWKDDDGNPAKGYYFGFSGPYSRNSKDLLSESQLTTIFFDEEYDAKKTQQLIQDHIKSVEAKEVEKN